MRVPGGSRGRRGRRRRGLLLLLPVVLWASASAAGARAQHSSVFEPRGEEEGSEEEGEDLWYDFTTT